MNKQFVKLTALAAFLAFSLSACQKEDVANEDDPTVSQSAADAEAIMSEASDEAAFRMAGEANPEYDTNGCPEVTFSQPQGTFPNTMTVDYGELGCTTPSGRVKTGKIIVEMTDDIQVEGAIRTITPVGYSVNGYSLEGVRTVVNQGLNDSQQMFWTVDVTNGKLTRPDGQFSTWEAHRTRTRVDGAETPEMLDDVYEITGTETGTCFRGHDFESNIIQPLVKRMDCRWIVSGIREMTVEGRPGSRTLDFGDGTCDDQATVTRPNGNQVVITLRR